MNDMLSARRLCGQIWDDATTGMNEQEKAELKCTREQFLCGCDDIDTSKIGFYNDDEAIHALAEMTFTHYTEKVVSLDDEFKELAVTMFQLSHKIIPFSFPKIIRKRGFFDIPTELQRNAFTTKFSFNVISYDWLIALRQQYLKGKKCLEIMSGSGLLSKGLRDIGVNVIATDNFSWCNGQSQWFDNLWTPVENIDAIEAIRKYGKDVDYVIVSWAYMDDTCYRALLEMRKVNPNCQMIFIGEYGDCCADENFTETAEIVVNRNKSIADLTHISWVGIHDRIFIVK